MSVHVKKQIGYFLPREKFSEFLVSNYREILDEAEDNQEDFEGNLKRMVDSYNVNFDSEFTSLNKIILNHYLSDSKYPVDLYKLIDSVYKGSSITGILFSTPDNVLAQRHNELIDIYEVEEYQENWFFMPIMPNKGYIYKGGLENYIPNLQIGTIVDEHVVLGFLSKYFNYQTNILNKKCANEIKETKCFHPNVDPLAFLIAKASGILLDTIDEYKFRTSLEPCVITSIK